ncbi:MAG: ferritin-like domain-containing protein [Thermomicrobiales bacterium]
MPLTSPRDLFIHELGDTLSAEQIILGMLPQLQQEARNPDAKKAFKEHEQETRQQIMNIQTVFRKLGEQPEPTTCYAAEGLKKEHEALHQEQPTPDVLEAGILGGAAKTEHYEIATYTTLVQMAGDLGETEVAKLLRENLTQEKEMAKRVTTISKEVGKATKAKAQGRTQGTGRAARSSA